MKRVALSVLVLSGGVALFALAREAALSGENTAGIPPARMGLVHRDVEAIPVPDAVHYNTSDPGDVEPPPPWNEAAPPVIPHGIADFLPITPSDNWCVDCHAIEEAEAGDPTPIPASHYLDLRNAPDSPREEIAGSRYVCTSCHVAQTEAAPLPDEANSSDRKP